MDYGFLASLVFFDLLFQGEYRIDVDLPVHSLFLRPGQELWGCPQLSPTHIDDEEGWRVRMAGILSSAMRVEGIEVCVDRHVMPDTRSPDPGLTLEPTLQIDILSEALVRIRTRKGYDAESARVLQDRAHPVSLAGPLQSW